MGLGSYFKQQTTLWFGSDAPLLLMTPFSRSKQQQHTPYNSIFVMIASQIILLLHHLEEKALKISRDMKEQHLFLGRPAGRSWRQLPGRHRQPRHAAARGPTPRRAPGHSGVCQPGCCTHPHPECALRPLLRHAGDNSPELRGAAL